MELSVAAKERSEIKSVLFFKSSSYNVPFSLVLVSLLIFGWYWKSILLVTLYLFLSNEECYGNFSEYVKNDEEASFYLRVYTHIMKFKLEFLNEEIISHCCEEAKDIMNAGTFNNIAGGNLTVSNNIDNY